MTSSEQSSPAVPDRRYSRRIRWLAAFVVLLFGGYTAAWFWAAGELETRAEAVLADLGRSGIEAECPGLAARGFPFRIGLFCDATLLRDSEGGVALSAGPLRSAAQVYDPFLIVGELVGPARIELADAPTLDLSWEVLKASARVAQPLPRSASTQARRLRVASDGRELFQAQDVQGHMRLDDGDLALAGSFENLQLDPALLDGGALPPLRGTARATVAQGADVAVRGLRGHAGTIEALELSAGENSSLSLNGPFSVDAEGLVDARLTLRVTGPARMAEVLGGAFPEAAPQIEAALTSGLLGDEPTLPLTIEKGAARLAFLPIGQVPPLR